MKKKHPNENENETNVENIEEEKEETKNSTNDDVESNLTETLADEISSEDEITKLQKALIDANDNFLRKAAELENYRKRVERMLQDERHSLTAQLLAPLFDAFDDLFRLEKAARESSSQEKLLEGLEMIKNKLQSNLAVLGVEQVKALGEVFDPNLHEVLIEVESDEHPPNTVVDVYSSGYVLKERLLRPAKVLVAKATEVNNREKLNSNQKDEQKELKEKSKEN